MAWWVVNVGSSGTYRAESASSAQAITDGLVVSGPYSSQAAAQAAFPSRTTPGAGSAGGAGGSSASAGGCGPQAIYDALLAAGFSTAQAIGAMANAMNESGLNPETPAGDGGHSFGLFQFYDQSYPDAPHPTGNCARDIELAVGYLKTHVSGAALNGHTGAEVAGNFAANFERCQGCQPGQSQWSQRVANAAKVEGWIASGNWPTSAAGISGGGGSSGGGSGVSALLTGVQTGNTSRCLVGGGILPCLLDASQARALIGGMLMLAGGLVALPGLVVILVTVGGPVAPVAAVAKMVPGPAGTAVRTASKIV